MNERKQKTEKNDFDQRNSKYLLSKKHVYNSKIFVIKNKILGLSRFAFNGVDVSTFLKELFV